MLDLAATDPEGNAIQMTVTALPPGATLEGTSPSRDPCHCHSLMDQLVRYVDALLDVEPQAPDLLHLAMTMTGLPSSISTRAGIRWHNSGLRSLKEFAPYAYYCVRVLYAFCTALGAELIGTRVTNYIDLQYVYYLPFCAAFSSSDRVHRTLAPHFLQEQQVFIDGDELKRDLRRQHQRRL